VKTLNRSDKTLGLAFTRLTPCYSNSYKTTNALHSIIFRRNINRKLTYQ